MVGDLGSQVEHAAVVDQDNHPLETLASASNATSSQTGWSDDRFALHSQSTSGNSTSTRDGVQTSSDMATVSSESPQISDEFGELLVAENNGNLAVEDRFWTIFCKEVCSNSAPL